MATSTLRVVQDTWHHKLSFALRFDDHFLGTPVAEELDLVAISAFNRPLRPTSTVANGQFRHEDGTYRFIDLRDGTYPIEFSSPSSNWVSWDPPLTVTAPIAQPRFAVARDLWPTPRAILPSGMTAVRGKLIGAAVGGMKIEIAAATGVFNRFTRADSGGEFLFPFPLRVVPETDGRIKLKVQVASGGHSATGIDVLSGAAVEHFAAATFLITPGRASRVKLTVT